MSTSNAIDLNTVRISLDAPISGFSHDYYPIYLNQNTYQAALSLSYRVHACSAGQPEQAIEINEHKLRIIPILRFGQTPNAVPEPQHQGVPEDSPPKRAIDVVTHSLLPDSNFLNTMSFHISSDCLSTGGFESTVRLRLLVLSPVDEVVLAFVDTSRFVVMTRELPTPHRIITYLRDWGFPIADGDVEAQRYWALQARKRSSKKRRLNAPCAFVVEDEQDPNPVAISMPDGKFLFTLHGLQTMSERAAPAQQATRVAPAAQLVPVAVDELVQPTSCDRSTVATPVKVGSRPRRAALKRELGTDELTVTKKSKLVKFEDTHDQSPRMPNQHSESEEGSVSSGEQLSHKFELELELPTVDASDQLPSHMSFPNTVSHSMMTPNASAMCLDPDFEALSAEQCATILAGFAKGMNLPLTAEQVDSMPHTDDASELVAAFQLPTSSGMNFMPATPWLPA
jgi:hypothetical protein